MSQEDMSCYGAVETDQYQEWLSAHQSDLEMEFLAKLPPEDVPLDDDLPDFMDDNADQFAEFCLEQFDLADHEIYPPRGSL